MIDISGINKTDLFLALYENAKVQGMGFLAATNSKMSKSEAEQHSKSYTDYCRGKVMKIDISGNYVSPDLYDRDNGNGVVERIVNSFKQ